MVVVDYLKNKTRCDIIYEDSITHNYFLKHKNIYKFFPYLITTFIFHLIILIIHVNMTDIKENVSLLPGCNDGSRLVMPGKRVSKDCREFLCQDGQLVPLSTISPLCRSYSPS